MYENHTLLEQVIIPDPHDQTKCQQRIMDIRKRLHQKYPHALITVNKQYQANFSVYLCSPHTHRLVATYIRKQTDRQSYYDWHQSLNAYSEKLYSKYVKKCHEQEKCDIKRQIVSTEIIITAVDPNEINI